MHYSLNLFGQLFLVAEAEAVDSPHDFEHGQLILRLASLQFFVHHESLLLEEAESEVGLIEVVLLIKPRVNTIYQ